MLIHNTLQLSTSQLFSRVIKGCWMPATRLQKSSDDRWLPTIFEELLNVVRLELESYQLEKISFKTSLSYE